MKKISLLLVLLFTVVALSAQTEDSEKPLFISNGFWDNWYIGLGVQGDVYANGSTFKNPLLDQPTLDAKLFFGKWIKPEWGFRVNLQGGTMHPFRHDADRYNDAIAFSGVNPPPTMRDGNMQHYEYVAADIEFVVNLTNIFSNYRPDRFYNLSPFVGVGYAHAFKDDFKPWINNSAMVSAGILNTFKLSNRFDAFIELSGYLVDEAFDGTGLQGDWQWEGIATGSAGIIVKLGKSTWDQARLWDQGLVDDLNNTINRLREENAQLAKRPKSCPPQVECPVCPECPESRTFVTPGSVEYFPTSVVFFRLNSAVVDKSQEINVYNIARYMQDNPDARIKCVGYADAGTGKSEYNMKLSARRAEAVAKQLINKYGISADRVTTESKGSDEQIYDQNDWNRVVIFFAD